MGSGTVITVHPDKRRQTIVGIGTSFTEASAFVLAHLDKPSRAAVMENIYGQTGANFSLARTPIGSTDFSVEGKYSYAPVAGDRDLDHFSISVDIDGFCKGKYPGIKDETFDLLPMIKQAQAIKAAQEDRELKIIASAWTAPPWMKDIGTFYIPPDHANDHHGTGGELKPEYQGTYADYLVRYLDAYEREGVRIWGLTPVNEPHGNGGQWESMHFTPQTQNQFIREHLGPELHAAGHGDKKLLIYDQNRDGLEEWTELIYSDAETSRYVYGAAVHWYSSTFNVHEDVLERVHDRFPDKAIIHTEGTIDDLGKPAPEGVIDAVGFTESGWFDNDAFWWNDTATDWAYTATWSPDPEQHPAYTPVHRYARNIIVSLNHWMEGWIDWNIVLDSRGGPNHVGNFCGAPIMIDLASGQVYYTPVFYVLAQFSRTIRPGDQAVQTDRTLVGQGTDDLHASATINPNGLLSVQLLNTTKKAISYRLQIGAQYADMNIEANAVQTVRVQLTERE
jgi:glucosylceramidase